MSSRRGAVLGACEGLWEGVWEGVSVCCGCGGARRCAVAVSVVGSFCAIWTREMKTGGTSSSQTDCHSPDAGVYVSPPGLEIAEMRACAEGRAP